MHDLDVIQGPNVTRDARGKIAFFAFHAFVVEDSRFQQNRVRAKLILVPRCRAPFGQHQESRPLARSNTGSPRFTDFPSLCACSVSSLTNLIGSDLNLLCLQSHSKTECRWTRPEVAILGADQKERGLWGREWAKLHNCGACVCKSNVEIRIAGSFCRPQQWQLMFN